MDYENYWLASIFIALGLDFVFDFIFCLIPGIWHCAKYRGYYYDHSLGASYKRLEEE